MLCADPWDRPVALTRMWCLYEIVHCNEAEGVLFALAMAPTERAAFLRALQRDHASVESALTHFDSRAAKASIESDRVMIMSLIEERYKDYRLRADAKERHSMRVGAPASTSATAVSAATPALNHFNEDVRAALRKALAGASLQS